MTLPRRSEDTATISRPWLWAGTLALVTAVMLPYLFLARNAGEGYVFTGVWLNWRDGLSYLAKMQEGAHGAWRFTLPYTAQPGQGAYLFLFHLALGHLAHALGLALPVVYHAARLSGAVALALSLAAFYRRLFAPTGPAWAPRWAWLWALFGGGLGWLALPGGSGQPTLDLWLAEAYPFLSALANAHFPWALAAMVWLLTPRRRAGALAVGAALALAVLSPFGWTLTWLILALDLALGVGLAWRAGTPLWEAGRKQALWPLFGAVTLGGGPYAAYTFWATHTDPVLRLWTAQNATPLGPWWDVVLSFAPPLLLALWGGGQPHPARRRLLTWAGASLVLAALPLALQRRFFMGWYVPLVGLAVLGLARRPWGKQAWLAAWFLSLPTVLLFYPGALSAAQSHLRGPYLPRDEAQAMTWLAQHTAPDALVLASPASGPFIPALADRRVLYGHPMETVNAVKWRELTHGFFAGCLDVTEAHRLVEEQGVDWIYYGPEEQALGGFPLGVGVEQATRIGRVVIYRVEGER